MVSDSVDYYIHVLTFTGFHLGGGGGGAFAPLLEFLFIIIKKTTTET